MGHHDDKPTWKNPFKKHGRSACFAIPGKGSGQVRHVICPNIYESVCWLRDLICINMIVIQENMSLRNFGPSFLRPWFMENLWKKTCLSFDGIQFERVHFGYTCLIQWGCHQSLNSPKSPCASRSMPLIALHNSGSKIKNIWRLD